MRSPTKRIVTDPRLIGKLYRVLSTFSAKTKDGKWVEQPIPVYSLKSHSKAGDRLVLDWIKHKSVIIYLGTIYDRTNKVTFAKVLGGELIGALAPGDCRLLQLPWIDYHSLPHW